MAILTCESCQSTFEGRLNRRYCSIDCRRKAEMKEREIKKEERRQAMLAAMTPEERAFYDNCREWGTSLLTTEELWPDLKPWGEELQADWKVSLPESWGSVPTEWGAEGLPTEWNLKPWEPDNQNQKAKQAGKKSQLPHK